QAAHLRAASSPLSRPYLYPIPLRPPAVPTPSRPSPEVISLKPLGVLITLLKATLTGVLASVDSKRLNGFLTCLESTLTKNRGEGGSIVPSSLLLAICAALLISPSAKAQEKSPPPHRVSRIEVYESSEELHETLQEKPALTVAAARAPQLTITVSDAPRYQHIAGSAASLTL